MLDFILMYCILRNVCFDKIEFNVMNKKKWGKNLIFGDKSFLVVIEIIWECRNELFVYVMNVKIKDFDFNNIWINLEVVLVIIDKILLLFGEFFYKMKMGIL